MSEVVRRPILWIVRGLPGSGKSTLAGKLGCLVVEPFDHISRVGGVYVWEPEGRSKNGFIFAGSLLMVCATAGCDVAVAEVITRCEGVRRYVDLMVGYEVRVVDMPLLSVEESFGRNVHGVRCEDIVRMRGEWEFWPGALSVDGALASVGL